MEWKDYLGDRMIAVHSDGFFVIRQKNPRKTDPIFCPVCDFIMKSFYDDEAYRKFSCCDACASSWAYPHSDKWKSGWRPTKEEVMNNCKKRPI